MFDCTRSRRLALLLGILLSLLSTSYGALGDPQEQRVQIGLRLFRALLAADEDLGQKVSDQGQLRLALLYRDDRRKAEEFAAALKYLARAGSSAAVRPLLAVASGR